MSVSSLAMDDFDGAVNESPLLTFHVSGDVSLPLRVKLYALHCILGVLKADQREFQ